MMYSLLNIETVLQTARTEFIMCVSGTLASPPDLVSSKYADLHAFEFGVYSEISLYWSS